MGVRLPAEYQEVEYLESTGTQWIDTGIIADNQTGFFFDAQKTINNNSDSMVIGSRETTGDTRCWIDVDHSSQPGSLLIGWNAFTGVEVSNRINLYTNRFNVSANYKNNRKVYVDGNEYVLASNQFLAQLSTQTNNLYVFGANSRGQFDFGWIGKIYIGRITKANVIIADYVPCYRKSDDEPGMYDLVSKTFYTNQGTGEFLVGPNVIDNISPWLVTRRRALMSKNSHSPTPTWIGLSMVEATAKRRFDNASEVYNWIIQYVPNTAWYWMACIEMDLAVAPSTNNQLIVMYGIAGATNLGSFIRYRSGAYQQQTSTAYNTSIYDLVVSQGQKVSIFYNTGNTLLDGTVEIPDSSLKLNVTTVQGSIENAEQLKTFLNGIHSGMISSVLNVDHADTDNYISNYNYVLTDLVSADSGTFIRWVNGNMDGKSVWSSPYDIVLHPNDILVSIF